MRNMNRLTTSRELEPDLPRSEAELVDVLRAHLVAMGSLSIAQEVRSHGRARTDLILWDGESLVGIEAKLRDWIGGVGQAALNRLCYDRSYLAMWDTAISDALIEEAERFGLGVLVVDHLGVSVLLGARQQTPIPKLRERVIELVGLVGA